MVGEVRSKEVRSKKLWVMSVSNSINIHGQ
jgi:hypothetical protein